MDNLFKIVEEGKVITITGDELLLITFVKKKIYQKNKINKPEVANKLAGYPYWVFEYRDVLFSCNILSFFEAFEANDVLAVQLIRCGKYFNVFSYSSKKEVNKLNLRIAKRAINKEFQDRIKDPNLSLIETIELYENTIKNINASTS